MSEILKNIRCALRVTGTEPQRLETVKKRLNEHPQNLVPEEAMRSHDELIAGFLDRLEEVEASVAHVDGLKDVANEIARYLIVSNLPQQLRRGEDDLINEIDWSEQPDLQLLSGPAQADDVLSLTCAFAGAAETGTLFVASGLDNPVTLSFLPPTNIILIRLQDVVGSYEKAWQKLQEIYGKKEMPRTVNLISGPSRTADIEQTLITGAHGPRHLHVIVIG
jgi:L-lactate dehydrogenase complex protein LldG